MSESEIPKSEPQEDHDDLGDEWESFIDEHGKEYFYNKTTGKTQWERPEEEEDEEEEEEELTETTGKGGKTPAEWVETLHKTEALKLADVSALQSQIHDASKQWKQEFVNEKGLEEFANLMKAGVEFPEEREKGGDEKIRVEILNCLSSYLDEPEWLTPILSTSELLPNLVLCLAESSHLRLKAEELLSVITWLANEGRRSVLEALESTHLKDSHHRSEKGKKTMTALESLVKNLKKNSIDEKTMKVQVNDLVLINSLVNSTDSLEERVNFRAKLNSFGFEAIFEELGDAVENVVRKNDQFKTDYLLIQAQLEVYDGGVIKDSRETSRDNLDLANPEKIWEYLKTTTREDGFSEQFISILQMLMTIPEKGEKIWNNCKHVIFLATQQHKVNRKPKPPAALSPTDAGGEPRSPGATDAPGATPEEITKSFADTGEEYWTYDQLKQALEKKEKDDAEEEVSKIQEMEKKLEEQRAEMHKLSMIAKYGEELKEKVIKLQATVALLRASKGALKLGAGGEGTTVDADGKEIPADAASPEAAADAAALQASTDAILADSKDTPEFPVLSCLSSAISSLDQLRQTGKPLLPELVALISELERTKEIYVKANGGEAPDEEPPPAPDMDDVPPAPDMDGPPEAPPLDADGIPMAPPDDAAPVKKQKVKKPIVPVNPSAKLRKFHWNKIEMGLDKTVWKNIDDEELIEKWQKEWKEDVEKFENLFSQKAGKEVENKDAGAEGKDAEGKDAEGKDAGAGGRKAKKKEAIRLVDEKRSYAADISLARFRMTPGHIRDSILAMDEKELTYEKLSQLIKIVPTTEEIQTVKAFQGDPKDLGNTEQFYLALADVPALQTRLEQTIFKLTFPSLLEGVKNNLKLIESALKEVRENKKLESILRIVLAFGNYLNSGTKAGGAYGFKLNTLKQLKNSKASDNKTSLLMYLVTFIKTHFPDLHKFADEMNSTLAASKIEKKSVLDELRQIKNKVDQIDKQLKDAKRDDPSDRFYPVMSNFYQEAKREFASLEARVDDLEKNYADATVWFGESPSSLSWEEFFEIFESFVTSYKQAEKRVEEEEKALEKEKKRQDWLAQQSKLKGAGGAGGAGGADAAAGGSMFKLKKPKAAKKKKRAIYDDVKGVLTGDDSDLLMMKMKDMRRLRKGKTKGGEEAVKMVKERKKRIAKDPHALEVRQLLKGMKPKTDAAASGAAAGGTASPPQAKPKKPKKNFAIQRKGTSAGTGDKACKECSCDKYAPHPFKPDYCTSCFHQHSK